MSASNVNAVAATGPQGFAIRILASDRLERAGEEFHVAAPIVIGRDAACTVVLADPTVSRRHARVEPTPAGLRVIDLDSGGGIWIGSQRLQDQILAAGDQFRIGSTVFTCVAAVDAAAVEDAGAETLFMPPRVPEPAPPPPVSPAAPEPVPEPYVLRVVDGADAMAAGTEFLVANEATIGRSSDCTITIAENDISRKHALLTRTPGGLQIADLGSSCGTWVGSRQIQTVVLHPGERVRLGNRVTIELVAPASAAAAVEPPAETSGDATRLISASEAADAAAADVVRHDAPPAPAIPSAPPQAPASVDQDFGGTVVIPIPTDLLRDTRRIDSEGVLVELDQHEPFLLDDPNSVWHVVEGGVLIFAVALEKNEPVGARTHFLGVLPGQVMFGFDLQRYGVGSGFIGVAKPGTKVRKIPMTRFRQLAYEAAHVESIAAMIDAWTLGLSKALIANFTMKRTEEVVLAAGQRMELDRKRKATAGEGVLWVDITSGGVLFDDMVTPVFTRRSCKFPLTPHSWMQPVSDEFGSVSLRPAKTIDLMAGHAVWHGLEVFHAVLCECEFIGKKLSTADEYIRLQEKAYHAEAAREAAYDAIGSVLSSEGATPVEFRAQGDADAVIRACQLVANVLGMEAKEHPAKEEGLNFEQQVAAIAIASGFRTRVVALRGEWWREDNGPLLGQLAESNDPVALLQKRPRGYEIVDPQAGTRTPVTAETMGKLSDFAYTLYAPFPEGELTIGKIVRFGARAIRKDLAWVAYMAIILGVFGTVTPFITGRIFDAALPQADRQGLVLLGIALVCSAMASSVFQFVQGIAVIRVQRRIAAPIQSAVWDRLLNLPVNFFRKFSAGDLADRSDGIADIQDLIAGAGVAAILGSISGLFYVLQMFSFSLYLASLAIVLTVVFVGVNMAANYAQLRYQRREFALRGSITGLVLNLLTGVTKLRVCGAEEHAFRVWAEQFAQQRRITFAVGSIQIAAYVFASTYGVICSIAIFYVVVTLQSAGGTVLTTGDFIAFTAAFGLFLAAMQALGDASLNLLRVIPIYERIQPILEEKPEVDRTKAFPGKLKGAIELSRVSFRYSSDGPWILKDVSLKIQAGEMVAFVGSSGGGKSTLMRLMLGFEMPTTGAILYDGQDLSSIDLRMLRQQLGVVLQTSRVMPTEIFRNIVGVSSKTVEDAWGAAERAGMAEDIRQMPMGMHTYVSEGGGTLSGGQRQRLMIARAIVNNPKILFLDEATSALDNKAQAIVTESMDRMASTRIVIAHRLSTIKNATRICYLHGGQIAEQGTYEELMKLDGLFASQARRQLA
jgi:ATP-binding cassette subfamily C protein